MTMRSRGIFIIVLLYFMQLNFPLIRTEVFWEKRKRQMNSKSTLFRDMIFFSDYQFISLRLQNFQNLLHKVHRISTSYFVVTSLESGISVSDYCFSEKEKYFRIMCFDIEAIRLKRDWV